MTAPVGNIVSLYLDTLAIIHEGDILQAQSGRSYRVVAVRRQERGEHKGRWHLSALVIDASTITSEDRVVQFVWYSRDIRRP